MAPELAQKGLEQTEDILKKLLLNIEAYKVIEAENGRLRKALLKNQEEVKKEYYQKLKLLQLGLKQKEKIAGEVHANILLKYKSFTENLNKKVNVEREKNDFLKRNYAELMALTKNLLAENKQLKATLENYPNAVKEEIKDKLEQVGKKIRVKQRTIEQNHKTLLREYEEIKLELNKRLINEKSKTQFLAERYSKLMDQSLSLKKDYLTISDLNKKIITRLKTVESSSLANKEVLKEKVDSVKTTFESKLKNVAKDYLEKELEYKARIESLNKDLGRYHTELKTLKERYYNREKELKEKVKGILES